MLARYINNLARMLKYHVLDRDLSKGRHLTRLGSAPLLATSHGAYADCSTLAWVQGLLHRAHY